MSEATTIAVQDLTFYQDLANWRGLVPMFFVMNAMPHARGDTAGFAPADARAMHLAGQAVPVLKAGTVVPDVVQKAGVPAEVSEEIARLNAIPLTAGIFAEDALAQITKAMEVKNMPKKGPKLTLEAAMDVLKTELERREDAAEAARQAELASSGALTSHGLPRAA